MTDHPGDLIARYYRNEDVYFLLGYDDQGNIVVADGGHSDENGVAEAMELHQRLFPSSKEVAFWKMAVYTAVPGFDGILDEESIRDCKEVLEAYDRRLHG